MSVEMKDLSELDKEIVRVLQEDFPLVEEPYKVLAARVGVSEEVFLEKVRNLAEEKCIRKMGAVLRHREVGFSANVLCAWEVPEEQLEQAAMLMSAHPSVSHCYERTTAPDWPYNLYTMIHAHSRQECEQIADMLGRAQGLSHRAMLYSKKEWKKTSMKYFCEK